MLLFMYKDQIVFKCTDILKDKIGITLNYPKSVLVKNIYDDIFKNIDTPMQFYKDLIDIDIFNKIDIDLQFFSYEDIEHNRNHNNKYLGIITMDEYGYCEIHGDDGSIALQIINTNHIRNI